MFGCNSSTVAVNSKLLHENNMNGSSWKKVDRGICVFRKVREERLDGSCIS